MTDKMELFWYKAQCTKCKSTLEHTFTPTRIKYADKYNEFVSTIAPSHYGPDYVIKRCDTCRCITKQEVVNYAPAYNGIE
ncbi:MAG: hypothetical protein ACOCVA_00910 [Prolixibacteraceae bacterium]